MDLVSPDQTFEDHRDLLTVQPFEELFVSPDQTFEDHRDLLTVQPFEELFVSPDQTFEDHRDQGSPDTSRSRPGLTGSDLRRPPRQRRS